MFKGKAKLFDSTYKPAYENYVEGCKVNHVEPQAEDSNDYWEYVYETRQMWFDDFFRYGLKSVLSHDKPCLISGTLGLWDGRHDIQPVKCVNLAKAIKKCFGSCDDYEVEFSYGVIYVTSYHHDGVNTFEIKLLSTRGVNAMQGTDYGKPINIEVRPYMTKNYHIK